MTLLTGWLVALYVVIAALSGIGLGWHYAPDPASAHASVVALEALSPFASLLRAIHHHTSHAAIALAFVHIAVVLRARRERFEEPSRWVSGVVAWLDILAVAFSGRVLPWDQHGGVSLSVAQSFLRMSSHDWLGELLGDSLRLQRLLWFHLLLTCAIAAPAVMHGVSPSGFGRLLDKQGARAWKWMLGFALLAGLSALLFRAPLGPAFDRLAIERVTAEWYLRWTEAVSVRSAFAARWMAVILCVAACTTPWWGLRLGVNRTRAVWWAILAVLALLTVLPLP